MKRKVFLLLLFVFLLTACGKKPWEMEEESKSNGEVLEKNEERSSNKEKNIVKKDVNIEELADPFYLGTAEKIQGTDGQEYYENTVTFYEIFDTVTQITMYARSEEEIEHFANIAYEEFLSMHKLMDNYNSYEGIVNVMTINEKAAQEELVIDPLLFDTLAFAKDHHEKTLGKTNIAMGSVFSLWHNERDKAEAGEDPKLPSEDDLKEAAKHMDIESLELNEQKHSVFFKDPLLKIDVGAVGKGYATEQLARVLKEEGLESGIISAGGNVKTIGLPVDGRDYWKIGISNPKQDENSLALIIEVGKDMSVVTSGDYQRFFTVGGKKYHHIIDPITLYPITYYPSVTIVTEDSGLADLLSTSLFLSNDEEREEILKAFFEQDIQYILLDKENNVTTNMDKARIEDLKE